MYDRFRCWIPYSYEVVKEKQDLRILFRTLYSELNGTIDLDNQLIGLLKNKSLSFDDVDDKFELSVKGLLISKEIKIEDNAKLSLNP